MPVNTKLFYSTYNIFLDYFFAPVYLHSPIASAVTAPFSPSPGNACAFRVYSHRSAPSSSPRSYYLFAPFNVYAQAPYLFVSSPRRYAISIRQKPFRSPRRGTPTPCSGFTISGFRRGRLVATDPTDQFLFVLNARSNTISVLSIDSNSGALAEVLGSPVHTPTPTPSQGGGVVPTGPICMATFAGANSTNYLYIAYRNGPYPFTGAIIAFQIGTPGASPPLTPVSLASFEAAPVDIAITPQGFLYAALQLSPGRPSITNPSGVGVLTIDPATGVFGFSTLSQLQLPGGFPCAKPCLNLSLRRRGEFRIRIPRKLFPAHRWLNSGAAIGRAGRSEQPALSHAHRRLRPDPLRPARRPSRGLHNRPVNGYAHASIIHSAVYSRPEQHRRQPCRAVPLLRTSRRTSRLRNHGFHEGTLAESNGSPKSLPGSAGIAITHKGAPQPHLAELIPSFINFNDTAVGSSSSPATATFTNAGTDPLNIVSIAPTGADGSSFSYLNTCPPQLAPQHSCTITITFTPTETGALESALTVLRMPQPPNPFHSQAMVRVMDRPRVVRVRVAPGQDQAQAVQVRRLRLRRQWIRIRRFRRIRRATSADYLNCSERTYVPRSCNRHRDSTPVRDTYELGLDRAANLECPDRRPQRDGLFFPGTMSQIDVYGEPSVFASSRFYAQRIRNPHGYTPSNR